MSILDITSSFKNKRTHTITLPEIKSESLREQYYRAVINKQRLEFLNGLKTALDIEPDDTEYTDYVEIPQEKTNVLEINEDNQSVKQLNEEDVADDCILMENTEVLSKTKQKVYDTIIKAFKDKGVSDSSLFFILQNIPFIDIVENIVVVYTKSLELFDKVEIPCVNLALALRETLKNDNLKVKFSLCKFKTISDYFSKQL